MKLALFNDLFLQILLQGLMKPISVEPYGRSKKFFFLTNTAV